MNKIKNGFTLVELLAVLTILSIIALIITPAVLKALQESRKNANIDSVQGIIKAADIYYSDHVFDENIEFDINILDTLEISGERPDSGFVYLDKDGKISVGAIYGNMCLTKDYRETEISVYDDIEKCEYVTPPNVPKLDNGLVGITINDDGTVAKADTSNSDWYNYSESKWANAVVLNDKNGDVTKDNILAYYVWVPRYEYKTGFLPGNGKQETIEINFISKDVTEASDDYIIPPGFTFGEQNLSGIWVAKYEPSYSNQSIDGGGFICDTETCVPADNLRILPGVTSLRNISVSESFYISRGLENSYGLDGNSHLMRNSEWATVSYLSISKYGKNSETSINSNENYITGGGTGDAYISNKAQSNTGNITGIYDMSGSAWEYMMSSYGSNKNNATIGVSGFTSFPDSKYYDVMYNSNNMLGHALSDTAWWFADYATFASYGEPWVIRGGYYVFGAGTGLYAFNATNGYSSSVISFRPVFVEAE